jgi:hypothetical protein
MKLTIPYNFTPRFYQLPFLEAMDSGFRRALLVWHRKSGKTKTLINFSCKEMFKRVGAYYHCFPEYGQGKKIVWDGMDEEGFKMTDHFPQRLRKNTNNTEMKITMRNNSIYQIIGADNYDSLVGPNPVGLIMDEYAVSERYKQAWDYFRPILANNGGWAVFPFTPRGRNHGWDLYQMAQRNPKWFTQLLTVEDTKGISVERIDDERKAGMSENMIQQEFYCSFIASIDDVLIPFTLIQEALRRDVAYYGGTRIAGLDVARFGDDRNALIVRQAGQIQFAQTWSGIDTVQTAGKVSSAFRNKFFDVVAIDVIGLGAGVYDMIRNAQVPCVPVNVSEAPSQSGRFVRLRDELWWKVREWFEDLGCSISQGIPEETRNALVSDIQDIRYSFTPKGLIRIESKDEMKARLHFSPDLGDALCCTFSPDVAFRTRPADRLPFGIGEEQKETYNPLTFGLA